MHRLTCALLAAFLFLPATAQQFPKPEGEPEGPVRLPNGKLQSEEILKSEHAKSLEEAAELQRLVQEMQAELEKNDRHVVSVSQVKRLEQIEKLAKRIRNRLTR